jgi:oxalate decarboxylase/phosphoglucose isomerase-like protein (cupin superfamily)
MLWLKENLMTDFDIFRPMAWDKLVHEYDLDGARLLPWNGYPTPIGGGWCVVRPHTKSLSHTQIDQEFFIGIKGTAQLIVGDQTYPFTMGDIAAIPKHTDHYVFNDTDEDFHFYVVWWDRDSANRFLDEDARQAVASNEFALHKAKVHDVSDQRAS